ncbi:hypothetical protein J7K74_03840 [Candidatus Woesearchaeota archaeon]|nr:hypothetical protein [Candidatus Woesearchaeota archaeon]
MIWKPTKEQCEKFKQTGWIMLASRTRKAPRRKIICGRLAELVDVLKYFDLDGLKKYKEAWPTKWLYQLHDFFHDPNVNWLYILVYRDVRLKYNRKV